MDLIQKQLGDILQQITGADHWIAIVVLVLAVVGWLWIGTKRTERNKLKRQLACVAILIVLGLIAIGVRHWFFPSISPFPIGRAGILVLGITGDDGKSSAQRDLVSALDTELEKAGTGKRIEVRAIQNNVDIRKGSDPGHIKARKLGSKFNALLVVWGDCVGTTKFHPRITIVRVPERRAIAGERALLVQDISQVNLPEELINEPIFLARFCLGYGQYRDGHYRQAIEHFRAAIRLRNISNDELADTRFLAATCLVYMAQGERKAGEYLSESIDHFQAALTGQTEALSPQDWAATQNNLGVAYDELPTGDRAANVQKAIGCYQAALRVRTEAAFPQDWAGAQNNLGGAYSILPQGDRVANLQKAIGYFQAALRVWTEAAIPKNWATTQNNLGLSLMNLASVTKNVAYLHRARESFICAARGYTAIGMQREAEDSSKRQSAVEQQLATADTAPTQDSH